MWDYRNEMDRTNLGSTIRMKFADNEVLGQPYRFQRIYICFAACKFGFKAGCRKIIGVDGCWLKGPMYGTQLLSAVGIDGNNNIFPISHANVEKENKDTWTWFLTYLVSNLDIQEDEASWTFMSDKQKGLIEAFNDILPYVSHRFCVRHLHNNFKRAGLGSFSLKKALWAAAKATTMQQFIVCMNHMFELDPNVAAWCNEKEPSQWTMTYFSSHAKSDMLLNNVCEVYNSMILDSRDKPILTLLLRYLLMARMLANREKAKQWNLGASISWIIGQDSEKRTCSYRKWSLTGIPCKHAIAAIWANRGDILDYVHDSYNVETYRKIYENAIFPMNGPQMWPRSNKLPPLPPRSLTSTKRGRKKKKRRKEVDEVGASRTMMKRKQKSLDCSTCHKSGHKKRTCKTKDVQPETTTFVRDKLPVRQRSPEVQQQNMKQRVVGKGEEMNSSWKYSQQTQQSGFLRESGDVWCNFGLYFWRFSRAVLDSDAVLVLSGGGVDASLMSI
ncbi:uncharacterized protein LOC107024019 [Solanum pennellii]|uniref:Uncharacterized protein LOC107024019 n=1 Tax=Solanum pennellii TaxID=28526 RepID=A0ABM1H4V8_SOLPN|nr:uncharacterized protein LOC107024019 [Solanum pennellii]